MVTLVFWGLEVLPPPPDPVLFLLSFLVFSSQVDCTPGLAASISWVLWPLTLHCLPLATACSPASLSLPLRDLTVLLMSLDLEFPLLHVSIHVLAVGTIIKM